MFESMRRVTRRAFDRDLWEAEAQSILRDAWKALGGKGIPPITFHRNNPGVMLRERRTVVCKGLIKKGWKRYSEGYRRDANEPSIQARTVKGDKGKTFIEVRKPR